MLRVIVAEEQENSHDPRDVLSREETAMTNLKQLAAASAVELLQDGMLVGLGSGSTAAYAVEAVGRRVRDGLRITAVATSEATAQLARQVGIPLAEWNENTQPTLTIDGADEVERGSLNLVKGHGGALLREKIVASVSERLIIVVDEIKLVARLGRGPLPVEVVSFGWQTAARRLRDLGATASLRVNQDGKPFMSDGGHFILDCKFENGYDPQSLAAALDRTIGVVEHGLFLGMTAQVHVAASAGIQILSAKAGAGTL